MPFRVFLIPVLYGEDATEELNAFVASHRIVSWGHGTVLLLGAFPRIFPDP